MSFCLCLNGRMATLDNHEFKAIKGLIEVMFDEKLDEKLGERLSHLHTKDEFYTKMDEVMGKLQSIGKVIYGKLGTQNAFEDMQILQNVDQETWEEICDYRKILDDLEYQKCLGELERMKNGTQQYAN